MDLKNIIEKYNNVSKKEVEKIGEISQYGRESILTGPLVESLVPVPLRCVIFPCRLLYMVMSEFCLLLNKVIN